MNEEIGNLLEFVTAGEWGKEQGTQQGIDTGVIRSANFTKDHQFNEKEIIIRSIDERKRQKKMLKRGDILIEKSGGSPDQPVGRVLFYDREGEHTCSNFISILRPSKRVEPKFLYYALCNLYREGVVKNYQQQTTGIINLQLGEYLREKIYSPPIPEQKKIAMILSEIDKCISLIDLKIEKLDFLFNAQRQKFLEKQSNWNQYKISDIADPSEKYSLTGGPFGSDLKVSDYRENGIRVIQLQNIEDSNFNHKNRIFTSLEKANSLMSSNIFGGDLIIAKMGDPVAKCTIVPNNLSRCLMSSDGIRLKVNQKIFDNFFIELSINSPYFRKKTNEISTGTTRQRIGLQEFRNLTIACPHINEQRKISQIMRSIKNANFDLDNRKFILKNLKIGLSSDLLSGQRRIDV